jgi:ABC-type transporter Mla subunit MlaD
MERISRVTARVEERLEPDLATVRGTLEDVRSVAADLRESMPEWTRRVDSVLARADNAAARLEPLMQSADETIGSARSIIEDNRDELDRIIANIDRAAERFSGGSLDQLEGALAAAQDGAEEFARTGRELSGLVRQERPNIERILANLRLAADQIKLTGIEVRRNPWRLLYTPTTKELDSELFYDAARTYAAAVSDLRAASEALEAAGREPPTPQSSEAVGRITAQLNDAFARYKTAEQGLLQQMIRRNTR